MVLQRLREPSRPNSFTIYMGKQIKQAREERGYSQEQLAELVERSRPAISEMENGKMEPDASTLLYLCIRLNKPLSYFFPPPYARKYDPTGNTTEEQEMLVQFRRLDKELQRVAINQVRVLADLDDPPEKD